MRPRWVGFFLIAVALVTSGCSDFVDSDQLRASPDSRATLTPDHPVGQTFVAHHGGLDGVEFWLDPEPGSEGELQLHLRAEPDAEEDLTTATLPAAAVTAPGFYRFSFSPLHNSHGRYYYAFVEMAGTGEINVGVGPGDAYLDGALHRDHEPQDAQSRFRLIYDPQAMAVDLVGAAIRGAGLLGIAGLLYVVPGWALLTWLWPERLSWAERLGLAAGVSLALYPLLFLWTDLVGLHLGPLYAWIPVGCGLAALVWRYRDWRPRNGWKSLKAWARSDALWPDLALLVVTGLVFGVRLLVVRTLDAPMWGDSYQHTMIAQLMVDHGGLFESWEPYVPYRSLTIHYGFPATTALLSWATKMGSVEATLWTGQLVNGIAALTLYPLAVRLADGNRWAGAGAVLTAGLLSPMPAYYVNWGRYAQLAGQAILPAALWLLWDGVEGIDKGIPWNALLLAGSALSGMTVTYYRMPFYYALFVLSWLVGWGVPRWGSELPLWLKGFGRLALIGGIALLLFLPWGANVAGSRLTSALTGGASESSPLEAVLMDYRIWRNIGFFVPQPLMIAALIVVIWSVVRRHWVVLSLGLWMLTLALLVAGRLVGLPGANMMQNFAVLIALYIPIGLLVGWLIGQAAGIAGRGGGRGRHLLMAVMIMTVASRTAIGQMGVVRSSHVMVTRPDMRAMAWIRKETPSTARFLVEGFRIYNGYSAVGSDAGWWIPLLTKRENTMPPQYALLNEIPAEPDYARRTVDLIARLETISPASAAGAQLLCERHISHVYVGQGQGEVGAGAVQLFSPDDLTESPLFERVYREDRVRIFSVRADACGVTNG